MLLLDGPTTPWQNIGLACCFIFPFLADWWVRQE